MPRLEARWSGAEADPDLFRPRRDLVLETEDGPGRFVQTEGPFQRYERQVQAEAAARSPRPPATGSPSRGSVGCSRCPLAAACSAPSHRPHGGANRGGRPPAPRRPVGPHPRPARRGAADDRVLQHPLQPDGGLRGGRVRRQRGRAGRGRLRRTGRHHPHGPPAGPGRPDRPAADPGRHGRGGAAPRAAGALAPPRGPGRHPDDRPTRRHRAGLVVTIVAAEEMPPGSPPTQ